MKITNDIREFVKRNVSIKILDIRNAADAKKCEASKKYKEEFEKEFEALKNKYLEIINSEYSGNYKISSQSCSISFWLDYSEKTDIYNHYGSQRNVEYDIAERILTQLTLTKNVSTIEDIEQIIDTEIAKIFNIEGVV